MIKIDFNGGVLKMPGVPSILAFLKPCKSQKSHKGVASTFCVFVAANCVLQNFWVAEK